MSRNNAVVAFLCRDEKGFLSAVGKSTVTYEDFLHMFERWIQEDPTGYDIFKAKVMTAFDLADRDLDNEEKENETKNSTAERNQ